MFPFMFLLPITILLRLLDGKTRIWNRIGRPPEEEWQRDRSTDRGLRHDASGDWDEGGGEL